MIRISYGFDRRILTFPAVHPCSGISPATLLQSLITLSRNICDHQSMFFQKQKRNSREAIRQIRNLLIFFEEIADHRLILPDSIILCFSELHFTFQKLQFLLEDCNREGARLWVLMKSEQFLTQFRILIRTIATALDVLPLQAIDLSMEVRELIELIAKQAQKTKFEIDPDDERAMNDVYLVLNQFEKRITPNPIDLHRILEYLKIQSWSDCNREIKFLDEEIELESSNGSDREVELLSSLMAFMSYCRCVFFDFIDCRGYYSFNGRDSSEVIKYLNSNDFLCPISLEIMNDPVTISTGHTYDRSSIQKWFKAGNLKCPKTGEKLIKTELVPNLILRNLIRKFCYENLIPVSDLSNRNRDINRTILAGSPAAAGAMRLLSEFLAGKLLTGGCEEKNKASYEIRLLTKSNIFNRFCLIEAGTIPYLLNLLSLPHESIQENAIADLLNLSKHSKSKTVIVDNGGLKVIIDVLKKGLNKESRQIAAATLFYISSVEEYRKLIGENPDAIPALFELIKNGTPRGKKNSIIAIFGILQFPENYKRVLENGAIPLLINVLTLSEREDLVSDSLAVLATLAEKIEGAIEIICASALPLLLGILKNSTSMAGKDYCVSILLSLCIHGGMEVIDILQKDPSIMESLYSLLTEGSSRQSKKVSSLLSILHEFHNQSSSSLTSSSVLEERLVHVR